MGETAIFGAIIGGIAGYVIATARASSRFHYLGGNYGRFEGGMGCLSGCLLQLLFVAIGAGVGAVVSSVFFG